jgi:murein DD-endopeptidase MepM/ murein hydrolase activator NlpD
VETTKKDIRQLLVRRDSALPISQEFKDMARRVSEKTFVPEQETSEYTCWIYKTPVDMEKVTSFGSGYISPTHQKGMKNAVDFYVPEGTDVRAPAEGVVARIYEKSKVHGTTLDYWLKGNAVLIKCAWNEYVWLVHLQHNFATELGLKAGQKVNRGEKIGMSGNTGFTENPHVHMEVLKFTGDPGSKKSLGIHRNFISKRIAFDWELPFDLYLEEQRK